jgi:hypothetical protein
MVVFFWFFFRANCGGLVQPSGEGRVIILWVVCQVAGKWRRQLRKGEKDTIRKSRRSRVQGSCHIEKRWNGIWSRREGR